MSTFQIAALIVGYIIMAGGVFAATGGMDGADDTDGFTFVASILWPLSLALAVVVGVFLLPLGILKGSVALVDMAIERHREKEAAAKKRAAEVRRENARLERELGIGGDR